jgi:hypothetical protein
MQNCVFNRGCEGQKGRWLGDEPNELNFLIYEENIFYTRNIEEGGAASKSHH